MDVRVRPASKSDIEDLVQLSLLAWAPVFDSIEKVLGSKIYALLVPDWRRRQQETVERVFADGEKFSVWVAEVDGAVAGFIAFALNVEDKTGKVELLAMHPRYQNRGIGTKLNNRVLEEMKGSGIKLVTVGTGGDPGHAPARRSYEKAGYTALPIVQYIQAL